MRRLSTRAASVALAASASLFLAVPASSACACGSADTQPASTSPCGSTAEILGYSDALDGAEQGGAKVGGLSSMAYDPARQAWASAVDNHADDPSRIWFFQDRTAPQLAGDPLILKRPDGTPYTGKTADNEGLAVLPNGDYLVSSETEPSVRVFGRDGVEKSSVPVPSRFGVKGTTPAGEASENKTLEGLTVSPDGNTMVASMEGALSGDVADQDESAHRLLVFRKDGETWRLAKQVGYRAEPGNRIPEVQFYDDDHLLVEEADWSSEQGNTAQLYAVTGLEEAKDVSEVQNLSQAPDEAFVQKVQAVDVTDCPSQGATAKQHQANPLMDNYEGMAVSGGTNGVYDVGVISDNNFNPEQITRVLNLRVWLPQ